MKKTFKSSSPSEQRVIFFYHQVEIKYLQSSIVFHFCIHSLLHLRQKEKEKKDNKWMNTGQEKKEGKRKNVLWIQMKIFATEKLLLVSAAATFFIFLFEVVIEASRGIRWEKESFCCSFYSRTKTNFHFSIFDSDCQIVIRQKKMLEFAKAVKCDW